MRSQPPRRSVLVSAAVVGLSTSIALSYLVLHHRRRAANQAGGVNPSAFVPVRITSAAKDAHSPTTLLSLSLPSPLEPSSVPTTPPIWAVFVKNDDLQIERPYTPLGAVERDSRSLQLWVKNYPDGEMGRWLSRKRPGECIEIRGPVQTLDWSRERKRWRRVLLISGGTGITPFIQLLNHAIAEHGPDDPQFVLLHSSRSPAELPPPSVIAPLMAYAQAHPKRLSLHFFVDSPPGGTVGPGPSAPTFISKRIDRAILKSFLFTDPSQSTTTGSLFTLPFFQSSNSPQRLSEAADSTLVIVCGPDPMIASLAGARTNVLDPGPVKGILGEMGFTSENVRKL